jgi:hypothetical protein
MLPEDFLELALSRAVDANTLTEFLRASNEQRRVGAEGEGLFHDFKSGKLFELTGDKLREEKRELRRDLVGFAELRRRRSSAGRRSGRQAKSSARMEEIQSARRRS